MEKRFDAYFNIASKIPKYKLLQKFSYLYHDKLDTNEYEFVWPLFRLSYRYPRFLFRINFQQPKFSALRYEIKHWAYDEESFLNKCKNLSQSNREDVIRQKKFYQQELLNWHLTRESMWQSAQINKPAELLKLNQANENESIPLVSVLVTSTHVSKSNSENKNQTDAIPTMDHDNEKRDNTFEINKAKSVSNAIIAQQITVPNTTSKRKATTETRKPQSDANKSKKPTLINKRDNPSEINIAKSVSNATIAQETSLPNKTLKRKATTETGKPQSDANKNKSNGVMLNVFINKVKKDFMVKNDVKHEEKKEELKKASSKAPKVNTKHSLKAEKLPLVNKNEKTRELSVLASSTTKNWPSIDQVDAFTYYLNSDETFGDFCWCGEVESIDFPKRCFREKMFIRNHNHDRIFPIETKTKHFVVLSNIIFPIEYDVQDFDPEEPRTKWYLYDSMNDERNVQSADQVMPLLFPDMNGCKIITVKMQKQSGKNDGGLFACAIMEALCLRKDPSQLKFDQQDMREKFTHFLQNKVSGEVFKLESCPTNRQEKIVLLEWRTKWEDDIKAIDSKH